MKHMTEMKGKFQGRKERKKKKEKNYFQENKIL